MRILIAQAQFGLGGTETYTVTVGEQLERLGHPVRIHAGQVSEEGRALIASRGLALTVGPPTDLVEVDGIDAVIAQDTAAAYAMASRRSDLRQIFIVHGFTGFEHPASALRPVPPVVVLNDRTAARARALAGAPPVVRLRQPIDIERFRPRGSTPPVARRVLALSNYIEADRLRMLEEVCGDLGLELHRVGVRGEARIDPQAAIVQADIVVGYGRSVLEALAMGRAAYVWDRGGGDGWVTAASYPALEANGFAGGATGLVVDAERMRADFAAYRPELGTLGYDLIRNHHSATRHAEALVELLAEAPAPHAIAANETISLLVRAETRAAFRADGFEAQARQIWEESEKRHERIEAVEAELAREREAAAQELAREREARREVEARLADVLGSRSWRALGPPRRLRARLRSLLR